MPKKPKKPWREPAERVLIIDEWDKWAEGKISKGEKGTDVQGLEFHSYLGREKPLLLEFKYSGNRWQQVKVWLREAERISRLTGRELIRITNAPRALAASPDCPGS